MAPAIYSILSLGLAHQRMPLDRAWEHPKAADWDGVRPTSGWTARADARLHEIAVAFTSDTWAPPEDRDLLARELVLGKP